VRCAWDYYQLGLAAEAVHRLAVQFQHRGVLLADDQQDGLAYPGQNLTGQVRAATVRTIVARLEGGGFQLQPFLVISIISATRDILTVGAELSLVGGRFPVARTMTELAVNAGVVLALSVVLALVRRFARLERALGCGPPVLTTSCLQGVGWHHEPESRSSRIAIHVRIPTSAAITRTVTIPAPNGPNGSQCLGGHPRNQRESARHRYLAARSMRT
jgi:hypothetical protein